MLPLALLHAAQGKPMLIELKTGETFNGHMIACDNFMNVTMRDVYQTSEDGTKFWKMTDAYLKGSNIKYIRVADQILDQVKEHEAEARQRNVSSRGGPGGRGRGQAQRGRGGDRGRGRGGGGRGRGR